MPGVGVVGMIQPYEMGSLPARDAVLSPAAPMGTLTSALANATPDQQRTVCLSASSSTVSGVTFLYPLPS